MARRAQREEPMGTLTPLPNGLEIAKHPVGEPWTYPGHPPALRWRAHRPGVLSGSASASVPTCACGTVQADRTRSRCWFGRRWVCDRPASTRILLDEPRLQLAGRRPFSPRSGREAPARRGETAGGPAPARAPARKGSPVVSPHLPQRPRDVVRCVAGVRGGWLHRVDRRSRTMGEDVSRGEPFGRLCVLETRGP